MIITLYSRNTVFKMIFVSIVIVFAGLLCCNCKKTETNDNSALINTASTATDYVELPETDYVEYPDVESYFEENGDVKEIVSVSDSKEILSGKEVIQMLKERGFSDIIVTSSFTMDGEYCDEEIISESSDDKHPMYEAEYVNSGGELWILTIIKDQITASPITYQISGATTLSVLYSEKETLTSYDNMDNRFFITVPNDDFLDLRVVDRIDADTLDTLTAEAIEKQ